MALVRRDRLSPEAQKVADAIRMTNTSPVFKEEDAQDYISANRSHFAADVASVVARLDLSAVSEK
ncbi:MAG: hypothetical protein H7Y60_07790 [Rhodospirillaceae bacterium]|nr:hypothetical protein [Rhodospirillales bacterium]